jgi:hypothetical protein
MKVVDLEDARANLERFAEECRTSPIVVTVAGKPAFEMVPVLSDEPDFVDRLLEEDPEFRSLLEARRLESAAGKVSSLEDVRKRLMGAGDG